MENIVWHNHKITQKDRIKLLNQKPVLIWFTGLSGSGKSTIANEFEVELYKKGYLTYLLDGDNIRHGLNKDLGFDDKSRVENIRRIAEVAKLFLDSGVITISAFISPFKSERELVRDLTKDFIEVFVDTPIKECIKRDPKGLYKKALNGEIKNFTGIDSPYEKPENPEIILSYQESIENNVNKVINYLIDKGYINDN